MDRKKQFKRGIDTNKLRKKREEQAVKIRKEKKSTIMRPEKKSTITDNNNNTDIKMEEINKILSNDSSVVLEGLKYIRKLTSNPNALYIKPLINLGIASKVLSYIKYVDHPSHQLEAAWILTNLVSGDSESSLKVIQTTPIGPYMIDMFKHTKISEIRIHAIWCLSNIGGESKTYRNAILSSGVLPILLENIIIEFDNRNMPSLRTYIWGLSNLLRDSDVSFDLIKCAIPVLSRLMSECVDVEVLTEAAHSLNNISRKLSNKNLSDYTFFNGMVNPNVLFRLQYDKVELSLLRYLGNLISGPDDITQMILNAGLLKYLSIFLSKGSLDTIIKEVCWIISNITAGTQEQIKEVIKSDILPIINNKIKCGNYTNAVLKECVYIYHNIIHYNNHDYHILDNIIIDILYVLNDLLSIFEYDDNMFLLILKTIYEMLNIWRTLKENIESCGLLNKIGDTQYLHKNKEIAEMAEKIITDFFEDVNDDIIPMDTTDAVFKF